MESKWINEKMCNFASEYAIGLYLVSKTQVFVYGKSLGITSMSLRLTWRSRTGWRCCRRPMRTSRSEIVTLVLNMLETCVWCQTQCFWPWEIIWDNFQEPIYNLKLVHSFTLLGYISVCFLKF